uniref:Uncharacterized protein n=1 Tax=Zea mays TaxID=4577 RepID=A0A804R8J8_MAIZE
MAGYPDAPPPIPPRQIRVHVVILPPPTASQSPPTPNCAPCPRPRKGQRPVEVARAVAVRGERVVATHERNHGGRRSSGRWRWPSEMHAEGIDAMGRVAHLNYRELRINILRKKKGKALRTDQ